MFRLRTLPVPVVGAPMAGGPTTPALVAAVSDFGGLGMLAAGYRSPAQLDAQLEQVQTMTAKPFGVNVFVPEAHPADVNAIGTYRDALADLAGELGVTLPEVPPPTDDDYDEKLELITLARPALCSFTFGCPRARDLDRLHTHGITTAVTVTSVDEAVAAYQVGAQVIIAQGSEAGGHRSTHNQWDTPNSLTTGELVRQIREVIQHTELIAAGGIATSERAIQLRRLGADAVQIGTLLLAANEAGTSPVHRAAVLAAARDTIVTRVFSGRAARGLANTLTERLDAIAVVGYPQVNTLMRPIKSARPHSPDYTSLWAGTEYRQCRAVPVRDLLLPFAKALSETSPRDSSVAGMDS